MIWAIERPGGDSEINETGMLFEKTNIKSLRETNVGVAKVLTDLQRRPYKEQASRLYCNILYAQP